MRMIVLFILASLVGYGAMQIDKIDPDNYVKIYLGHYVIEIKVLGLILLLLGFVLFFYFLLWLVKFIWRSPTTISDWQNQRKRTKADEQFGAGYLSLIKGDWRLAEKQLISNSDHSSVSYVNYLAAARAAQQQGRFSERDKYLESASQAAPKELLAIGLTKAKLFQKSNQLLEAQDALNEISELGVDNPQFTAMQIQISKQSKDWQKIQTILPIAKKQKALPKKLLIDLQNQIHSNRLLAAVDKKATWKSLSKEQRSRLDLIEVYVKSLFIEGDISVAEKLIRTTLKNDWSDALIDIYGQLSSDTPSKLLRNVQGWLLARPENAHLSLAAGRLANAAKFSDQAKQYLQDAISNGPLPEAYAVLGEVFETNNESSKALQMYRLGMQSFATVKNLKQQMLEPSSSEKNKK